MQFLNSLSPSKPSRPFFFTQIRRLHTSIFPLNGGEHLFQLARHPSSSSSSWSVQASPNDSQNFEVDQDKAREALKQLDQQLQSLSEKKNKQVTRPKRKAPDMNRYATQMREEMPEISGSFLGYSAFLLLVFTILYNILFYAVIKPAIDGP